MLHCTLWPALCTLPECYTEPFGSHGIFQEDSAVSVLVTLLILSYSGAFYWLRLQTDATVQP